MTCPGAACRAPTFRMQAVDSFLAAFAELAWGPPLLLLLLGGGAYFFIFSRFVPFRYFWHAVDLLRGKYDEERAPIDFHIEDGKSYVSSLQLGLIFDTRDDPASPARGQLLRIAAAAELGADPGTGFLEAGWRAVLAQGRQRGGQRRRVLRRHHDHARPALEHLVHSGPA